MIELTRLNGHAMVVNCDLVKYAESSPDTMLTLINGEKIVVLEPCEEVVQRITAYRAKLLAEVLKVLPADGRALLSTAAAGAANLGAMTAERAAYGNEVPDNSGDAAQQRRRRDGQ